MNLVFIVSLCFGLFGSAFAMESPSTTYDEFDDCRLATTAGDDGGFCDEHDFGRVVNKESTDEQEKKTAPIEAKRDPTPKELNQWFDSALDGNIGLFEKLLNETTLGDSPDPKKNFHVDVGAIDLGPTSFRQATALSYAINDPHTAYKRLYKTSHMSCSDPRYLAIYNNKIKIAHLLLDRGANPNRCLFYHKEITPLHVVLLDFEISPQCLLLLEHLLLAGAKPDVKVRFQEPYFIPAVQANGKIDGYTPLMLYAYAVCYVPQFDESFLFGEILRLGDLLWDASQPEYREKAFKIACRVSPGEHCCVQQVFDYAQQAVEAEKCYERKMNPLLVSDWAQKLGLGDLYANIKPKTCSYGRYPLPSINAVYRDPKTGKVVGCEVVHQNSQ